MAFITACVSSSLLAFGPAKVSVHGWLELPPVFVLEKKQEKIEIVDIKKSV